jgi:hypothetical protein
MFLHTPSVGVASLCGCTWSWSWEHDKSLNKGQQDLTKLNTTTSSICGRLDTLQYVIFSFGRNCSPNEEYVILWFYDFIKKILWVLWIETIGFLSQNYITPHNNLVNMIVLLEYFPTSINTCMWNNKIHASFYLKNVMIISLFKILNKVWFKDITWRHSWLIEFIFNN